MWKGESGGGGCSLFLRHPPTPTHTDVASLTWTTTPRGACLAIGRTQPTDAGAAPPPAGPQFLGLSSTARSAVTTAAAAWGVPITDAGDAAVTGANWGSLALEGGDVVFTDGAGGISFRVPLADVTSVTAARDDVALELAPDDDGGGGAPGGATGGRDDALVGVTFAVPRAATVGGLVGVDGGAETAAPAAALAAAARARSAAAVGAGGTPACTFDQVAVLAPRGRFDVDLFSGHAKLTGSAASYRVPYASIARALLLPRPHAPSTLVAVQLDPPLRKGAATYPFLLLQFPEDGEEEEVKIDLPPDVLAAKNDACGGRLPPTLTGSPADVFTKALRGLAGTKIAKPGAFRADGGEACGVRASLKSDDGYLFPLDRALFYAPKPPTLVAYDNVASIEFVRRGGGVLSASQKTFDLAVRARTGGGPDGTSPTELVFRGIARSEWSNLFAFLQSRHIVIDNLRDAAAGAGGGGGDRGDRGAAPDAGLARLDAGEDGDDDDESDADFAAGSGDESSDGDDSGSEGDDDAPAAEKPPTQKKKAKAAPTGATPPKKRAKKDENAPKKALSAFMAFSTSKREEIKGGLPEGVSFGDIAKAVGEAWKALDPAGRAPYEATAAADTERYKREMEAYAAKKAEEGGEEGGE